MKPKLFGKNPQTPASFRMWKGHVKKILNAQGIMLTATSSDLLVLYGAKMTAMQAAAELSGLTKLP